MTTCIWDGHAGDRIHVSHFGGIRPYAFAAHDHRGFYELVYVRRGVLDHQLDDTWRSQRAGMATLVRPGEIHALRGERVEYLNISFDEAFIRRLDPALRTALTADGAFCTQLPAGRRATFEADGETLAATTAAALQAALLTGMLCTVAGSVLSARPDAAVDGPPWLARLRERVADDGQPIPELATVRRWAGVSAEHLARTMQRHLGCTPVRWLHQLRVRRGARLLAATDLPVAAIATRCGYADPGLFHRRFQALHGCGPRAYRQREQRFIVG